MYTARIYFSNRVANVVKGFVPRLRLDYELSEEAAALHNQDHQFVGNCSFVC